MRRRGVLVTVLALVVALVPATASLAAPKKPHPVRLSATADPWVSTGIELTVGDPLEITAHGMAITGPLSTFPGAKSNADGQATLCPEPNGPTVGCALDTAPYGALIGRIGGVPFFIGSSYLGAAPATGTLELAVNDNLGFYFDNAGGFTVFVNR